MPVQSYEGKQKAFILLDCPLCISERVPMVNNLGDLNFEPTFRNLLYGNEHSEQVNIKALAII